MISCLYTENVILRFYNLTQGYSRFSKQRSDEQTNNAVLNTQHTQPTHKNQWVVPVVKAEDRSIVMILL